MKVTVRDIFGRAVALIGANAAPTLAVYLLIVGLGTVVDAELGGAELSDLINIFLSVILMVAQFGLTLAALRTAGFDPVPRFWRFFFLSIVVTIVIAVGLLALFIPGLILLARLSASVPAMLAEDLRLGEAMDASWRRTKDLVWPLILLFALIWVPVVIVMFLAFFGAETGVPSPIAALASNLFFNATLVLGWYIAVAVYILADRRQTVAEVFA